MCSNFVTISYHLYRNEKIPLNPSDCIIVVTGCDSGFRRTAAERLSDRGYLVVAGCLTKEAVKELKSMICNVTKLADADALAAAVTKLEKKAEKDSMQFLDCGLW